MSDKEIFDEFKSWGITSRRTQRALLALAKPDNADGWILERWRKLRVLTDDNRIILCKGESLDNKVQWIIFSMIWEGHVERVPA